MNYPQEYARCKRCRAWKNGLTHAKHDCTPRRNWIAFVGEPKHGKLTTFFTLSEIKKAVRFYEMR